MTEADHLPTAEKQKPIKGFKTSKGSIYTYDGNGKTTRFKAATNEQMATQDITVFVELTFSQEQMILYSIDHPERKVYILEKQEDGTPKIIRSITDVANAGKIYLAAIEDNKRYLVLQPANLKPQVGLQVYDTRFYKDEKGNEYSERHLGNKVAEIICGE
jgi:hypothetical protein